MGVAHSSCHELLLQYAETEGGRHQRHIVNVYLGRQREGGRHRRHIVNVYRERGEGIGGTLSMSRQREVGRAPNQTDMFHAHICHFEHAAKF